MKRTLLPILFAGALLIATPAHAATWAEPDITSVRGSLAAGDGAWLELPWTTVWEFDEDLGGLNFDPRAAERLPDGNTLITSRDGKGVYEIDRNGDVVWSYTNDDYPALVPFHATRLANGNTLIVNRMEDTVLEVTPSGDIAWRYGSQGDDSKLIDPFTAFRLPNGNTLIADNQASRVIEITPEGTIEWQYGITSERALYNGYADGYIDWPKWASRLENGNTLIADDEGHRVLEVSPAGGIAWSYGEAGVPGSGPGQLSNPVSAERLPDGSTMIADSGNNRIIVVARDGTVLRSIGAAGEGGLGEVGLSQPRRVTTTPEGTLLIADTDNGRLIELGHTESGLITSGPIDCGLAGARKQFTSIEVDVDVPEGTTVTLTYSVDEGPWTQATNTLPAETYGTLIRYRITLTTTRPASTPRLRGVSIGYQPAPEQATDDPGDGSGSPGTDPIDTGEGTSSGSGTSTTPRAKPRAAQPSASGKPGAKNGGLAPGNGTMRSAEGYASVEMTDAGAMIDGPVSVQRGWTLARVGPIVDTDAARRGASAPAPAPEGLILLGSLYAAGALSTPLGRAARAALSVLPAD
ncbi:MAG: hypothetical protein RBS17_02385 [Coriobacteriia bacterium]|nr:hypothetical protein [Coriobacteriia bacterium]